MAGDAACLAHVLHSLDEYTIVVMRGSEEHAEEDLQLVARSLTRQSSVNAAAQAKAGKAGGGGAAERAAGAGARDDIMAAVTQAVERMQARFLHGVKYNLEMRAACRRQHAAPSCKHASASCTCTSR
jgi:uncharacterized protein (UPF0254 family)